MPEVAEEPGEYYALDLLTLGREATLDGWWVCGFCRCDLVKESHVGACPFLYPVPGSASGSARKTVKLTTWPGYQPGDVLVGDGDGGVRQEQIGDMGPFWRVQEIVRLSTLACRITAHLSHSVLNGVPVIERVSNA